MTTQVKSYIRSALIMYAFCALLLFLGRVAIDQQWMERIEAWGWSGIGTVIVFTSGMLFPLALLGPGVVTVILIHRLWPGSIRQRFWFTVIPASILSGIISPFFWLLISDDQIDWSFIWMNNTWVSWVVGWLIATMTILAIDSWLERPAKIKKLQHAIQ